MFLRHHWEKSWSSRAHTHDTIKPCVGRNTQVRRIYTTPHKTQMIVDTTINLLVLTGRNAQISPALP